LLISKNSMANRYALMYTVNSFTSLTAIVRCLLTPNP
jgi:hypothetical protein